MLAGWEEERVMYLVGQEKERELNNLFYIFHNEKLVDDAYKNIFKNQEGAIQTLLEVRW